VTEDPVQGSVRSTQVGPLVCCFIAGLVGGWLLRRFSFEPLISWVQPGVLFFVAALVAGTAWVTRRQVHRRLLLEPHRAVNRLVLAKACALAGALVAGGYAGYAISWLGAGASMAGERMLRAGLAAVGSALLVGAALALERACRVPTDDSNT
jgi:MFS family permease